MKIKTWGLCNAYLLAGNIDHNAALELWGKAINTKYTGHSVWVHGDINLGNLLVADGNLSVVIDFGKLAVGDPACDLTIPIFTDGQFKTIV